MTKCFVSIESHKDEKCALLSKEWIGVFQNYAYIMFKLDNSKQKQFQAISLQRKVKDEFPVLQKLKYNDGPDF